MKRLAWLVVVSLLSLATSAVAYDGPPPILYNHTLGTIQVQATMQSKAFHGGRTKFTLAAHVPVTADHVGQSVLLQMRRYEPINGDLTIYTCSFTPTVADIGTTVVYNCDGFEVVPGTNGSTPSVEVYPYVIANSSNSGTVLEHNGQANRVLIPYLADDIYEVNNSEIVATDLGTLDGVSTRSELIWRNADYFKFIAGPGTGSAEVTIQFWNQAADLDIYVYDSLGELIALSATSTDDEERANFAVTPGSTYYVDIEAYDPAPAFYDLSVMVAPPDTVTITSGPGGSPNPVMAGNGASLSVTAVDSLGHPLTYFWQALCPTLPTAGSFDSRYLQNPTWTAPDNPLGTQQNCTIKVEVADNAGVSVQGSYVQKVDPVVHSLTITAGPTGSPNPVSSQGAVTLSVTGNDTFGHTIAYSWLASCPTLPSNGTFAPNANVQAPTWTAPQNTSGAAKDCTITATVDDGQGLSASNSYSQTVNSSADVVSITAGPTGAPNPVASAGSVSMSGSASDSLSHSLTYQWLASCPTLSSNGTFTNDTTTTPTWTAPTNATGSQQVCTITFTASDAFGHSANGQYTQNVNSIADTVTITAGPTGSPNPVPSAGSVTMSLSANDSVGHTLTFSWQASCPTLPSNGNFTNGSTANPTWTAPINATGSQKSCTVTATADDGQGHTASGSYNQLVDSAADAVTITAGPSGAPNPVASGAVVAMSVSANDSVGHSLSYAWSATCVTLSSNGLFSNTSSPAPTWTAPVNMSGAQQSCSIDVSVSDGFGHTAVGSFNQLVNSINHTVTITAGPTGSPNPVESAASASLSVAAIDSLSHGLSYTWSAACPGLGSNGTFAPNVNAQNPTWQAPVNSTSNSVDCEISVQVSDGQGQSAAGNYTHTVKPEQQQTTTEYRYYFAEGATIGGFFQTRFALLNTDASQPANVSLDFQLKDTTTVLTHTFVIGAHSRSTIDVAQLAGQNVSLAVLASAEFSTVVRSDRPLVADRTMTWDQNGYGSHAESAIPEPASKWYLAEGATIGAFELYYLIQNPNSVGIDYTVTYLLPPPAAPIVRVYHVGPNTRTNIPVHFEPGLADVEVSAIIESAPSTPIIVERAMYLTTGGLFYGAGHESAGIRSPETQWFFAEGATGPFFDLFILIGNPSPTPAHVTATFLFDDGTTCSTTAEVGALSRFNFWADTLVIAGCPRSLADAAISTTITADVPVIAERSMWWPGPSPANWAEAHNAAGATETGLTWGLADGEQGGARNTETYILVANTSPYAGTARVTLYLEDGSELQQDVALAPNSRTNVAVGAVFGAAVNGKRFGAVVDSVPASGQSIAAQVVVERAMYSNGPGAPFWAAGTDALATKLR
ncbi:MAG: hypothetical protein AB7I50_14390 [Vicinamibacterales bacterium]